MFKLSNNLAIYKMRNMFPNDRTESYGSLDAKKVNVIMYLKNIGCGY